MICWIKKFLTNFEIGHIGSQLIDLAQDQHAFVGWHAARIWLTTLRKGFYRRRRTPSPPGAVYIEPRG